MHLSTRHNELNHCSVKMNSTLRDVFVTCNSIGVRYYTFTKIVSKKIFANQISLVVFNSILAVVTALLNALAILTIQKSSHLKEKPCYFIILLQSSIDLICSLVGMPIFLVSLANAIIENLNCSVNSLAILFLLYSVGYSNINLFTLTWERYIAILHPYGYKTKVTKTKLFIGVSITGLVDFLMKIGLLILTRGVIIRYTLTKVFALFCYVCFAYTRIYLVVRNLRKKELKPSDYNNNESKRKKTKLLLQEVKTAKSCFMVVLCFFLLHIIPGILINMISSNWKRIDQLPMIMWNISFAYCNSSFNSLIFFWSRLMLRKEAIKFIKNVRCRGSI